MGRDLGLELVEMEELFEMIVDVIVTRRATGNASFYEKEKGTPRIYA